MSCAESNGLLLVRRISHFLPLAISGLFLTTLLASQPAQAQQRETIFDRVIHVEPNVLTEIPATPRLEDSLGISGRMVSVGDAELWVEEEGTGMPLVLINGGPGGTHHMFHPWFERAADFARVIYYDQRGCGLSDYEPGPDGYSVDQAVEDLEALRKALDVDRFVLAGFSYGGFLAQYYTTRYPENVAGLVLVGASPGVKADLGRSRQMEFISQEELDNRQKVLIELRDLASARGWTPKEIMALVVYNNHMNGDWKRQNYYRPSREDIARTALYGWVHDGPFNSVMGQSQGPVDLTGVFAKNPIPTLIMEGDWDLTWGPEKRDVITGNHPNGRLVTFEKAGHSIFDEDPDGFFRALELFVQDLTPPDPGALVEFQADLAVWREALAASPGHHLSVTDWGWAASQKIADAFDPDWTEEITNSIQLLRLGFALYDMKRYEESLGVFKGLQRWAEEVERLEYVALASIWQGHMLDLMGRHSEAIPIYQNVAEMALEDEWSHGQYGLRYTLSPWAESRIETPFERIENSEG